MRTSKFINADFKRQTRALEKISEPFFQNLKNLPQVNAAVLDLYRGLGLGKKFYTWEEWERQGFKPKKNAKPFLIWGGKGSAFIPETRTVVFFNHIKPVFSNLQVVAIH